MYSKPGGGIPAWFAWFWQFPQALLLLIFRIWLKAPLTGHYRAIPVYRFESTLISSMALGIGILLNSRHSPEHTLPHEYGHCRQSRILGPAYLLVVGLPSLVINLLSRVSPAIATGYYQLFPENWADRLGGVKRDRG